MILRVGLTGGIASGKSTAREMFGALGCHVVDADRLVAELYEPGRAGHRALVATYGEQILNADGTIAKVKLADLAFASPEEARKLNALIHPIVLDHTASLLEEYERSHGDEIVMVEATLMLEAGARDRYDRIVVVSVSPEVQIERGIARGLTREEVNRRIANQMAGPERLRQADYVIDNSGDREHLAAEVRRVWTALRADLDAKIRAAGRPGR